VQDILRYFRNLLVCRSGGPRELLALPDEEVEELRARAARFSLTELIRLVEQFAELLHGFDSQLAQRTALEALLIRISRQAVDVSVDTVLEKIAALQEQLNGGETSALAAPPAAGAKKKSPPVAKTASAPRAKPVATAANLDAVWRAVTENAAAQSLALGAFLPYARPVDIDGDRLILEIDGARESAAKAIDSPEGRAVVEAALAGETGNLRGYVVRRVTAEPAAAPAGNVTIPGNAVPAAFREAEADPGVAKVIDVFKGRIVKIQEDPGAAD
jgi:DNA polymerase III gamma/tau subunit